MKEKKVFFCRECGSLFDLTINQENLIKDKEYQFYGLCNDCAKSLGYITYKDNGGIILRKK